MDSLILQIMFMLAVVSLAMLAVIFYLRRMTNGKMLCWLLEGDRTARSKLLKIDGDFVVLGEEKYGVEEEMVRFVRYPAGWPAFLQTVVSCSIYERGRFEPLNWTALSDPGAHPREVGAVLEPYWMANIVRGTKEGAPPQTRLDRYGPIIALVLSSLTLVLLFYVVSRLMSIENTLDILR